MRNILIFVSFVSIVFSQARIGGWESFTSTLNVNEIVEYENLLVGATDGGLLFFDKNEEKFAELNNIDGLLDAKLYCLALGDSGTIWLGGKEPNGFVQIYDILNQKSVSEFNYEMSEIIDFAVSESITYAIYRDNNDYGLLEFGKYENEFIHKDLYPNWPNGNEIIEIEIFNNQIFAATEIGLFIGTIGTDPSSWEIPIAEMENRISSIFFGNDKLFYFTTNKLYSYNLFTQTNTELFTINNEINDITTYSENDIFLLSDDRIYNYNYDNLEEINIPQNTVNSIFGSQDNNTIISTNTGIAYLGEFGSFEYFIPNSPHQNNLQAIAVLDDDRFVGGGDQGLAVKDNNGWRSIVESSNEVNIQNYKDYDYFITDSIPVDFGATISKMVQGPDGLLYCAIEGAYASRNGGGILIIDIDDPSNFTLVDTTELDYFSDDYLIIKDINFDRDSNLWVADPFATNKHEPLHVRSSSGVWNSFNAEESHGAIGLTPSTLAIDAWKRVWIGSFQNSERNAGFTDGGLAMLSYSGEASKPDDINWFGINYNTNSNKTIWSLAITPENRLFMLTPIGLTFLDLQFSDDEPIKYESPRYYFPNISFGQESEVRVDVRGNAWTVSGSNGIHVLLNNSTFWPDRNDNIEVESINVENYPLLSDIVTDIAFNNEKGIAYISTNKGINSFKIPFADKKKNYSDLRVFPSPFHVPSDKLLIIDNLKDKSSTKIMTISGKVIRSIESAELGTNRYQIEWDGKDDNGDWVNSGVYLIAVYSEDGSFEFEKVAVIRH